MQRTLILLTLLMITLSLPVKIQAQDVKAGFVTIVLPVRDRSLWRNQEAHRIQLNTLNKDKLPATWLVQYSTLFDEDLVTFFTQLPSNQELGILLEVDEKLASDAWASYLYGDGDRARADKVLFSGYRIDERKRMIDRVFERFKEVFGYYPTSVGSWYIDTLSLGFMAKKYQISANMNVADQYQTDTYGVWGQPWSTPYYPSQLNSIYPASAVSDRYNVVNIQWAARDPLKGYGFTVNDSTYSVQVNDYLRHGLDIEYFSKLAKTYLQASNEINQLTVGLEVGQEGIEFQSYFDEQLDRLKQLSTSTNLQFTAMKDFARIYAGVFSGSDFTSVIDSFDQENSRSIWYSSSLYRINIIKKENNLFIRDLRVYSNPKIFPDIINKDTSHILQRFIPALIENGVSINSRWPFITNVNNIQTERIRSKLIVRIIKEDGKFNLIELQSDKIIIDGRIFFAKNQSGHLIPSVKKLIANYLVQQKIQKEYSLKNELVYSSINGNIYFGLTCGPDKIYALSSTRPFIGKFSFPFQILSKFKKLWPVSAEDFIFNPLINILNSDLPNALSSKEI